MEITFINRYPNIYQRILTEVDKHQDLISCSDRIISKIIRKISRYIDDRGKSTHDFIHYRIITKEIAQAYKEKKKEIKYTTFSGLAATDDFGESFDFEPVDMLARVSETALENISLKEKIGGLASTDSESFVLTAWINGLSDNAIATELALRFGGNAASKRIWVQRFRTRCQRKLSA